MSIQVLCILTAVSLLNTASCNSSAKSDTPRFSWQYPTSKEAPSTKIGKQMPPHHEPDAVLINTAGNGQSGTPEGNFPELPNGRGGPGVFGFPRPGPNRPDFFGIPGIFGMPRLPVYPNTFAVPGGQGFPGNPGMYGVVGSSGVFVTSQGQGNPLTPGTRVYAVRVGQQEPGYAVRTGYPGRNSQIPQPAEPRGYGQPGMFPVPGGGNVPFPAPPDFFFSSGGPNVPEAAGGFPTRGMVPETFVPNHGYVPSGMFPGVLFSETPLVPNQPGYDFEGAFPVPGGREMYDDPPADMFPLRETSQGLLEVPN